jgi:large subunit ribosomal protein L30
MTEKEAVKETKKVEKKSKVAIILIRGMVRMTQSVRDTLIMFRLNRRNYCVVVDDNEINRGMIKKIKDYVTYGEIDEATFKELLDKKGEEYQGRLSDKNNKYTYKTLDINGKKYKPYFRLNPPIKGYGRKGIKIAFKIGGALGNREDKINDLIKRML